MDQQQQQQKPQMCLVGDWDQKPQTCPMGPRGDWDQQQQKPQICPGGPSELKPITPEIKSIAESVKIEVEKQLNRTFELYVVVACKTQVVAGTNYLLKIHCGKDEYLHVKVYEMLPHAGSVRSVTSATDGHSLDDTF
ncbi:cystatin-A-like [Leucoraja erinacea]|uniref:cystatin-A-like n=1 Tax=Leucoraja erinaceus TaxID=7782 RepID=UPI0024559604|nr:cystatin-A-like [Leucoraja erinacea]